MQQHDLKIAHIAKRFNLLADWMSRETHDPLAIQVIEDSVIPTFVINQESPISYLRSVSTVPQPENLKLYYHSMAAEKLNSTYESAGRIKYAIRTNKIFIPEAIREILAFWFHASKLKEYLGVRHTTCRK